MRAYSGISSDPAGICTISRHRESKNLIFIAEIQVLRFRMHQQLEGAFYSFHSKAFVQRVKETTEHNFLVVLRRGNNFSFLEVPPKELLRILGYSTYWGVA